MQWALTHAVKRCPDAETSWLEVLGFQALQQTFSAFLLVAHKTDDTTCTKMLSTLEVATGRSKTPFRLSPVSRMRQWAELYR